MISRRPVGLHPAMIAEAIALDDILGVHEDAWSRANARRAVESLSESRTVILGGDVLRRAGAVIEYTSDSWHYDPTLELNPIENARESHTRALDYINAYPDSGDGTCLYVLVFDDPALDR